MDKKTKSYMILIVFAVLVYAAAMHLGAVLGFLGSLVSLVLPLLIGLVLAFVLSVPMNGYGKLLKKLFYIFTFGISVSRTGAFAYR